MDNNFETTQSPLESEHSPKETRKHKTISIKIMVVIAFVVIIVALAFYHKGLFVAATVDGSPISRLAVIRELEKSSGKMALEMILVQKLIDNEIRKKRVTVSSDEIGAEMKNIEEQIEAQGTTLDQALAAQGMTHEDFENQITVQKKLEKLLADKTQVTDDEVEQYVEDNEIMIPEGQEVDYQAQIKEQLRQQKLSSQAGLLIDSLRSQAKIRYFVDY